MGFQDAVATCFRKYFHIRGRAQRSEFWWWTLFIVIASIVLSILDVLLFEGMVEEFSPLDTIFSLITLIPWITVTARRLHDIDRSGWWQLLPLAPALLMSIGVGMSLGSAPGGAAAILIIVGLLAILATVVLLIVWFATDGEKYDNRFGPSPKYGGQAHAFD